MKQPLFLMISRPDGPTTFLPIVLVFDSVFGMEGRDPCFPAPSPAATCAWLTARAGFGKTKGILDLPRRRLAPPYPRP